MRRTWPPRIAETGDISCGLRLMRRTAENRPECDAVHTDFAGGRISQRRPRAPPERCAPGGRDGGTFMVGQQCAAGRARPAGARCAAAQRAARTAVGAACGPRAAGRPAVGAVQPRQRPCRAARPARAIAAGDARHRLHHRHAAARLGTGQMRRASAASRGIASLAAKRGRALPARRRNDAVRQATRRENAGVSRTAGVSDFAGMRRADAARPSGRSHRQVILAVAGLPR